MQNEELRAAHRAFEQESQSLHQRKRTLRAVLDAATESILLLDRDGIIVVANGTAAARFGRAVDDLVGRCAYDLFRPSWPGRGGHSTSRRSAAESRSII